MLYYLQSSSPCFLLSQPMSDSSGCRADAAYSPAHPTKRTETRSWLFRAFFVIVLPAALAGLLYRLDLFEPAHYPAEELSRRTLTAPARNDRIRERSEVIGNGDVLGPEDLAYDAARSVIYTGCWDGWIKRFIVKESVGDSVVENWVNTGGRPLGLVLNQNELIVGDADKGLLRVTSEGRIEVLVDEFDGLKFKLTDGVDVAHDGTIYFTDASHKYSLKDFYFDIMEGKPHGRFMSYNPATNKTTLLATNLYFANGVAVSPDQQFVVFCETILRRCKKYYTQGPKKGSIDTFCEDLPGFPDNIHYDGQGQYWIALASSLTPQWDLVLRYPFLRKAAAIIAQYVGRLHMEKNGGVVAVDLDGKLIAHYYDPQLSLISSGIKIGNHVYLGSIIYPFVLRLDVKQYPAHPTA